ncbi:hypothetical protein IIC65_00455 [Candidatus Sumerlaeota bacterium]|nr:hypothetical protein [Candidatus Sumerlaeota bacterium]
MSGVVHLDACPLAGLGEREGNGAQLRGELFIGETGDKDLAIDEPEIGNGVHPAAAALDGVGKACLGEIETPQVKRFKVSRGAVHSQQHGHGLFSPASRDREVGVAGGRIDGKVHNKKLVLGDSEHTRDLVAEILDLEAAGRKRTRVPGIECENSGGLRIGHEKDPLGAESQRPDGFEIRRALG